MTPPPRHTPQPIRYITNPTEAYALGQRYYQGERPRGGEGAIPSDLPTASGEAATQRLQHLPIVRRTPDVGRSPSERTTQGEVRLTEDGHRVFLPLAAIQGSGPPYKPHTLFMRATIPGSNNLAQYRSDDGGRTWQCMTPPKVRTRDYLPLLRIRS